MSSPGEFEPLDSEPPLLPVSSPVVEGASFGSYIANLGLGGMMVAIACLVELVFWVLIWAASVRGGGAYSVFEVLCILGYCFLLQSTWFICTRPAYQSKSTWLLIAFIVACVVTLISLVRFILFIDIWIFPITFVASGAVMAGMILMALSHGLFGSGASRPRRDYYSRDRYDEPRERSDERRERRDRREHRDYSEREPEPRGQYDDRDDRDDYDR